MFQICFLLHNIKLSKSENKAKFPIFSFSHFFINVTIARSTLITYVSHIAGWLYFLAWSMSFYPQIYDNFVRQSVVGLNFDYLSFNLFGFVMYGAFNMGLYWSAELQVKIITHYVNYYY